MDNISFAKIVKKFGGFVTMTFSLKMNRIKQEKRELKN